MSSNFILQSLIQAPGLVGQINEKYAEHKNYKCANPGAVGGRISTINQCEDLFFKDLDGEWLPGITFRPKEPEPSDIDIDTAFKSLNGCTFLETELGYEYLGCNFSDPDAVFSCNCPIVGTKYPKLLKIATKNATFLNTDLKVPLMRGAFKTLLDAYKIKIRVTGTFRVWPGNIVEIIDPPHPEYQIADRKLNGKWLVLSMSHRIFKDRHHETTLILSALPNSGFFNSFKSNIQDINIQT